jgi:hypothetical protein
MYRELPPVSATMRYRRSSPWHLINLADLAWIICTGRILRGTRLICPITRVSFCWTKGSVDFERQRRIDANYVRPDLTVQYHPYVWTAPVATCFDRARLLWAKDSLGVLGCMGSGWLRTRKSCLDPVCGRVSSGCSDWKSLRLCNKFIGGASNLRKVSCLDVQECL